MNNSMSVTKRNGNTQELLLDKITIRLQNLCTTEEKNQLDIHKVVLKTCADIYNKITTSELDIQASSLCVQKNTIHPEYDILAIRFIISNLHKNTSSSFSEVTQILFDNEMISKHYYDNVMKNKVKYNNVISKNENNDYNYNFFGFKTLERAYLLKIEGKIIE